MRTMRDVPNYIRFVLITTAFAIISCNTTQQIENEDIIMLNGLYVDAKSSKILDGNYITITQLSDEDVYGPGSSTLTRKFDEGIPVGEWETKVNDQLIFSVEYIEHEQFQSDVKSLTGCKRADVEYWGNSQQKAISIWCVYPESLDSSNAQTIGELAEKHFSSEYPFHGVSIFDQNDSKNFTFAYTYFPDR